MIYKLDLPPLEDCILDDAFNQYIRNNNSNITNDSYRVTRPKSFFKSEYLNLKDLPWSEVLIFLKTGGIPSVTHTDNIHPTNGTSWGVNWIYGGVNLSEYWSLDDFNKEDITFVTNGTSYYSVYHVPSTVRLPAPRLRYILKPGAYLVNTTAVHRITGFQNRYCVSYRATGKRLSWDQVTGMFSDLIVNKDLSLTR